MASPQSARPRRRPSSAPQQPQSRRKGRRVLEGRTYATIDATGEEDDGSDKDVELLSPQGGAGPKRRVKFVEGAAVAPFAPRGSAQAAARFARTQCQHRFQVGTTLRRGDRLSPRSPKCFRPASAQARFRRGPNGLLQIAYAPTTEVVAAARKFSWEEEADLAQQEALEAQGNEAAGLKEHVKHIWLMYQEQEAGKDEKDRALLMALQGPDEEDKELALQNEMKLLKTGEDAIAFFAKHGDQSDLQVIFCNPAPEEEGKYKPYDLVVVDEQDRGAEFFMISPKGIVHVCPGKQSEHFTLTDWMHQVMVFTVEWFAPRDAPISVPLCKGGDKWRTATITAATTKTNTGYFDMGTTACVSDLRKADVPFGDLGDSISQGQRQGFAVNPDSLTQVQLNVVPIPPSSTLQKHGVEVVNIADFLKENGVSPGSASVADHETRMAVGKAMLSFLEQRFSREIIHLADTSRVSGGAVYGEATVRHTGSSTLRNAHHVVHVDKLWRGIARLTETSTMEEAIRATVHAHWPFSQQDFMERGYGFEDYVRIVHAQDPGVVNLWVSLTPGAVWLNDEPDVDRISAEMRVLVTDRPAAGGPHRPKEVLVSMAFFRNYLTAVWARAGAFCSLCRVRAMASDLPAMKWTRAPPADFADGVTAGDAGSGAASSVETLVTLNSRRKRGSRGGVRPSSSDQQKRWRSGAVPQPPSFDGDIEADPYCYRHYKHRLQRWVEITKEYLPGNEQALRALENLKGEAETEMEEIEDSRYNVDNGIELLLRDLERSFGAKEMFRQGGTIREFESIGRLQGESVHAFVRRFRLMERKLKDNQVPEYPEQAKVIKLLDGLRLDEKSVASLLLAAGNKYDMRAILNAISIQYPAGMTITGLPRLRLDRRGRGRGVGSSASTASTSSRPSLSAKKWRHWNTAWEPDAEFPEGEFPVDQDYDEAPLPPLPEGPDPAEEQGDPDDLYDEAEVPDGEEGEWMDGDDAAAYDEGDDLQELMQSLTVTSKRLASLVQARGYYQTDGKGKGKGKKGFGKSKGKSKSKGKGRGKPSSSFGTGSGKAGKSSGGKGGKPRMPDAVHQQRLQGSLCLGCGSPDHWLKDCPSYSVQNAQLTSAAIDGLVLDAEGSASIWMVTAETLTGSELSLEHKKSDQDFYEAPPLSEFEPCIPPNPSVLLQYYQGSSSSYIIADTGCQRQVAGEGWHLQKCQEIEPLLRLELLRLLVQFPMFLLALYTFELCSAPLSCGCLLVVTWLLDSMSGDQMCLSGRHIMYQIVCLTSYIRTALQARKLCLPSSFLPVRFLMPPPTWLVHWRRLLRNVLNFVFYVKQMVLLYSATTLHSALKDRVMQTHLVIVPSTATTLLSTTAAMAAQESLQSQAYLKSPETCNHPSGMRAYGAAGIRVRICDLCGTRYVLMPSGTSVLATPKDSPSARLISALLNILAGICASTSSTTSSSAIFQGGSPEGSSEDGSPSQKHDATLGRIEPAYSATEAMAWLGERPDEHDEHRYGSLPRGHGLVSGEEWVEPNWAMPDDYDHLEGSEGEQFDPNDLIPHQDYEDEEAMKSQCLRLGAYFATLRELLLKHKPFLTVYEFPCTLWSNVQHLNYDQATLDTMRQGQLGWIKEMVKTIQVVHQAYGGHFLLENPAHTSFWQHPEILRLHQLPRTELRVGHMCCYDLRDKDGALLKKPTGWLSDLPLMLECLDAKCPGTPSHVHGQVLGGNSRRSQVYTTTLATAVTRGLIASLQEAGDERFNRPQDPDTSSWCADVSPVDLCLPAWEPPGESAQATIYFLDVNRHQDSWLPLLKEAESQLKDKVRPDKVIPVNSPFGEQLKALVPWQVLRIQICRTPMQRRLPLEVLQAGAKHRGAALWLNDGSVSVEAESVSRILAQSASRFSTPVRVSVFFFGTAPATSLDDAANELPEAESKINQKGEVDDSEVMKPHQPGFRDISFPGLKGAPKWLLQVMRRLHTNLGHPSTATMVRHLTASGASEAAIQAARHLRCEVCLRVQPPREPRPAKPFTARRFNDRLDLDVLWLKDISGRAHGYLSQVDEATSYHVLSYMKDRSEEETMRLLVNGWFAFFGPPDEMLLDSDGSFRGFRFETLQAQCAVKVRYAPADAHYQMGKVERHGQSIRYIVQRLVSQFAPLGPEELNVVVMMSAAAKNNLLRRAGSSPAQWVYGRNHKLPGSLLSSGGNVESCSLHDVDDSSRLRLIEQIRTKAMMLYHQFESDAALRAALLRKPRPARGPFSEGQHVAYYRFKNPLDGEGTLEGYRRGVIVAVDGSTLWIRNTRGRLISASKEQVRAVGGEEEWWAPSQDDLDLLKKSDQDLSDKHSSTAFRLPDGDVPRPSEDQSVAAELDFQLRAVSPGPRPVLDALGQPVLDAAGQMVPAVSAPAMLPPLMLVPPTPRSKVPSTPRSRGRSRSKTPARRSLQSVPEQQALPPEQQALPPEQQALPPEQQALPPEQQALPPEQQALPPEQQALPESSGYVPMPQVSGGHATVPMPQVSSGGGQDQPGSQETSRQVSSGSAGVRRSSLGTSQMERDLESLMGQMPSESSRGTKRPAEVSPEPPVSTQPRRVSEAEQATAESLLLFCQDCGEQHRISNDGVDSCSRCLSTRTVSSPMHVLSWFDEVKEREALEQRFENRITSSLLSTSCTTSSSFVNEFNNHCGQELANAPSREVFRLDVLRRHGRDEAHRVGWDGSPPELQEMFKGNSFLTAAHFFGDHNADATMPCASFTVPSVSTTSWTTSQQSTSASESLARQLREARDFSPSTLHQLLDAVDFPVNKRTCLNDGSGGFLLGLYSHGGFTGVTRASKSHRQLSAYILDYFRFHGMQGQATSLYISRNATAKCHRDSHNLRGSLNWVTSVGNFSGGALWVECKSDSPPSNAVYKEVNGVKVPGFLTNTKNQVLSFRPDCYHETQPFKGDRYNLVAYTTRSLPEASEAVRKKLRRMGFLLSIPAESAWSAEVTGLLPPQPAWLDSPVSEAYPARAWKPPGEGETMAMDTSGDEAHDGVQEPPSRAQRQALKKELPWQAMSETEVPQFVQAVIDEWIHTYRYSAEIRQYCPDQAVTEWNNPSLLYKLSDPHWFGMVSSHLGPMPVVVPRGSGRPYSGHWSPRIRQHDDWTLTVDQASYIAEVPITKISLAPEEKLRDHPEMITEFRSGIGSLQWLAGTTRGDIAADTSLLQKPPSQLTVADLVEVNNVLRYVRATRDACYKVIPISFDDMLLIAYGDSAWANAPGGKSQGGLVVAATSKSVLQVPQRASLLEWKSYRHQRVLRSTLAAEAASLDKAEDYGNFIATMLSEMVDGRYSTTQRDIPLIEVVPVTDARSLWDAIHRLSTSFAEKRVEISIATLRQQCRALRWVPTEQQLADVLTKRSRPLRDSFRKWMSDPWLIFGCGGVGGYFGARIAQVPGQKVSYIVRNKALAALKEHGVRITSICGDVQIPAADLGPTLDSQNLDKEVPKAHKQWPSGLFEF
ncbi:hypothetical protein AK812_SmicGene24243 [Symbiodinium microadriaticum]|uniref:Copia protein n=1 Tax=Symbiodinium microadriaticum TaxID=2951 RepID=A0A1Q9DF63_SYMMI|nr:hypothetical protein AK812_SmicGene24243 [Symbiodinium microadriaticum]